MSDDFDRFTPPVIPIRGPSTAPWFCQECQGRGLVFAVRTGSWVDRTDMQHGREWVAHEEHDRTTPTIFRCTCSRGQNDRRRYPSWADAPKREFRRATI